MSSSAAPGVDQATGGSRGTTLVAALLFIALVLGAG